MRLGFLEVGQDIFPGPADVAKLAPMVIVSGLAAHINHAIDRGAASKHLAARIDKTSAIQARLWCGFHHPVGSRIADAVEVSNWDMHPMIIVSASRFKQQDCCLAVCSQP